MRALTLDGMTVVCSRLRKVCVCVRVCVSVRYACAHLGRDNRGLHEVTEAPDGRVDVLCSGGDTKQHVKHRKHVTFNTSFFWVHLWYDATHDDSFAQIKFPSPSHPALLHHGC